MPSIAIPAQPNHRRSLSDWVGFVSFTGLALLMLFRGGAFVVLLPVIILDLLAGVTFLMRRPLRRQTETLTPHLLAYFGTFGMIAFTLYAGRYHPEWLAFAPGKLHRVGFLIWGIGVILPIRMLWRLRYAFSLVPQARELVTTGAYRWVRHPIYASYFVQAIGNLIMLWNPQVFLVLIGWVTVLALRARYEERVLEDAFPEYALYRARVGMFFPRLRVANLLRRQPTTAQAKAA